MNLLADYEQAFPLLSRLEEHLIKTSSLKGKVIGWHCHLTDMTAAAAKVLVQSGAKLFMSEVNAATTSCEAVRFMQAELGCCIFTGKDAALQVVEAAPDVASDTGFVLIEKLVTAAGSLPYGACEITQSGISRLRQVQRIPFPVININSGRLKSNIENFHGVGEGIAAVLPMIAPDFSGKSCLVVGYGQVGAGIAEYLRRSGLYVCVYDRDSVLQLKAHYDGFSSACWPEILTNIDFLITATGHAELIGTHEWERLGHGTVVINAGHWSEELDIAGLKKLSRTVTEYETYADYSLSDSDKDGNCKTIRVACQGNPANIVFLTGSHEPTFIHLACEILSLEYLCVNKSAGKALPCGEILIPHIVEQTCAELALAALSPVDRRRRAVAETVYFEKDG